MIALCAEHHARAGAGSYTHERILDFKAHPYALSALVRGTFDWLRRDLVTRIGGSFYVRTPIPIELRARPVVSVRRDSSGMMLLSIAMPRSTPEPGLLMIDNEWFLTGPIADFECPPPGRRIRARYANGDSLTIEFSDVDFLDALVRRFDIAPESVPISALTFPFAVAEIDMTLPGSGIEFTRNLVRLGGSSIRNYWSIDNHVGISF
jgi:hypothetical protein